MKIRHPIRQPTDAAHARALQRELAPLVARDGLRLDATRWIAAADVAYSLDDRVACAGVVLVDRDHPWTVVEEASWIGPTPADYTPGLFAFREASCLLPAFERLTHTPDVIMIDGHGVAHPRRFGLACHIGRALDVPTLGCAKKRLCGAFTPLASERGARAPIADHDEVIGCALRTRPDVKPVFVSIGHRIDLDAAVALTLEAASVYRLPEPLRLAHDLSIRLRASLAPPEPAP